ncbi:TPA: SGNH/GDSL hydrolase family protein, partial [Klebsiella pneumoniae]
MSNSLPEESKWEPRIYQLEKETPVLAGPGGPDNTQATQLANRTRWLKTLIESGVDYREYTFYKSESDPDGTIAGLANTPADKMFRVAQGLTDNFSFIYYLNDAGIAVPITAFLGPGAVINLVREYPTLPVAQNDADAGNILDGSKCWVDNTDDTAL